MCEDAGCETHVGVQSEPGGHAHGEVGEETHEEGGECGDGGGGDDEVPAHVGNAGQVGVVVDTEVGRRAYAGAAGVRDDGGVHGDLEILSTVGDTVVSAHTMYAMAAFGML